MLRIDREALAWAAGIFDGEGWCSSARYNAKGGMTATLTLGVAQAHPEMLQRLATVIGFGKITQPRKQVHGRTFMYSWKVYGFEQVQVVFALLWTWLGSVKREQIMRCLQEAREHPTNTKRLFNRVQLNEIRELLNQGVRQYVIARQFGCDNQTINRIACGRSYKEISMSIANTPEEIRNVAD